MRSVSSMEEASEILIESHSKLNLPARKQAFVSTKFALERHIKRNGLKVHTTPTNKYSL